MELDASRRLPDAARSGIDRRSALRIGLLPFCAGMVACTDWARGQNVKVKTGADALVAGGFAQIAGRRIGLVTNHTGRVGGERLIDVLARASNVRLAAILTPEHGLAGTVEAGASVAAGRDGATGLPVHSLYGKTERPTPEMLAGLDALVFDMQDIGVRYYTYVSTMGRAMQAAAAARLPFIVLDRPNPLGGEDVSGFVMEPAHRSFVGLYAIPQVHGMTVAELARMMQGERLLSGLAALQLEIVPMHGWQRDMRWPETGLQWVPTSPNIPTFETALAYAGTGLFEATAASEGRGTSAPFLLLGHPRIDASRVVAHLSAARMPGVAFHAHSFTPRAIAGRATSPRFAGRTIPGVRVVIADHRPYQPLETGLALLVAIETEVRRKGAIGIIEDAAKFARLAGTSRMLRMLDQGASASEIAEAWQPEIQAFKTRRQNYLLY